jgi:ribosomal protein S12 methylthiotransferase
MEDLVKEARNLARNGVKELILIAQELTYYGLDIYKKRALPELLEAISDVDGIEWIRLHYAYPSKFPLDILDVMSNNRKVCNYLDIPLQHAADPVLMSMKRQITRSETEKLISEIRMRVPDITLRTTMLVGFPGETEEDFEQLCDFVREQKFDRLGVFQYSHEEGTSAYQLEDNVPDELKQERVSRLMEIQQDISFEKNQQKIGMECRILVDRIEGDHYIGRTEGDSPEVDNEVLVSKKDHYLRVGDFAQVKITHAEEYDLFAELIGN